MRRPSRRADVGDDVHRLGQAHDRVPDELARSVPRDLSASVDVDDGCAVGRALVPRGPRAGGIHRLVLEEQEVSGRVSRDDLGMDPALERPAFEVRDVVRRQADRLDVEHVRSFAYGDFMYCVQQYARRRRTRTLRDVVRVTRRKAQGILERDAGRGGVRTLPRAGFEATSIADITTRAGVSRSSFFNYFASKSDILWSGLDERIAALEERLTDGEGADAAPTFATGSRDRRGLRARQPRARARERPAMRIEDELEREAALRRSRIARAVADRLRRGGTERLDAEVAAAAWAGAVLAALEAWAHDGAGRTSLERFFARAAASAEALSARARGTVRQLRVVVQAAEFDAALAFYRDVLGMPQAEAYEADGGARVVILDAGRATLELANPAQVAFIDRVETDGGASDPIRSRSRSTTPQRSSSGSPSQEPRSRHPLG